MKMGIHLFGIMLTGSNIEVVTLVFYITKQVNLKMKLFKFTFKYLLNLKIWLAILHFKKTDNSLVCIYVGKMT